MTEAIEVADYREKFVSFLKEFQDPSGAFKYRDAISSMASQGKTSLVIDFEDLISFDPDLAKEIKEKPLELFPKVNAAIYDVMRVENMQYASKVKNFRARFRKLDEAVPLRSLKSAHMGKLIMVEGIITRASAVKQLLKSAVYQCPRCGEKIVMEQTGSILIPPSQCTNQDCGRKGFFRLIPEESSFIDWQLISIQERPEELPPGQLPRSVEGILQGDIVDTSRPGDRVSLVGILQAKQEFTSRGFRLATFSTGIEANHIEVAERGTEEVAITPEDEKAILKLASDPNLYDKLIGSIAPSIYAYDEIKEAVAYQLAGGVTKTMPDGIKIRGDINILLVGDPGTAKSQLLQYVSRIAPRGVYTSGKGSTAAGLTATVIRDKNTGEFFLEAGALVIADKGIACIDEIDKMRPEDRSAIHEAMEQQSYHPSNEIELADGTRWRIGDLVEGLFSRFPGRVVQGVNCEILDALGLGIRIFTTDFKRKLMARVDRVSRHPAPDHFVRIKYSNGKEILVTPEHPVFVLKGGSIATVPAASVAPLSLAPAMAVLQPGLGLSGNLLGPGQAPASPSLEGGSCVAVAAAAPLCASSQAASATEGLCWVEIVEVERVENAGELRTAYVYDVTVEPTHNFISDGMVLHNTISIAKAGIVVQLNARTSILAAANPSFGRYVPQKTISENINDLPVTILSRFDLIFTLLDRPDEIRDKKMTEHILRLHRGMRVTKESPIDPDLLKKYIYYVRKHGAPKIGEEASKAIEDFFLEMRAMGQGADSPVPITMRQLEAVIRLSEARAKLALKKEVSKEDVQAVIRLLKTFLKQVGIDSSTGKIDIDTIMVGHPKSQGDKMSQLFDIFVAMERENEGRPIKREALIERAGLEGLDRKFVEKAIFEWINQGVIYEPKHGELKKA